MSIPEILLVFFFFSALLGVFGFAVYDQWKRTQAYNGMMEQFQESICSISNDFSFFVGEYAYSLMEGKHNNYPDSQPAKEI